MKSNKKIIAVAGVLILILSATFIYPLLNPSLPTPTIPLPIEEEAVLTIPTLITPEPIPETKPDVAPILIPPPVIQEKFVDLLAQNEDVLGWLTLPNTNIDYVVVQSDDNDYYLHRDLNHKTYEPGTLFTDFRNSGDAEDRYAIIYGHNMKNGSMFGTLKRYKDKTFYNANRIFTYSTLYEDTEWEIFAAYVSPPTLDLIITEFENDDAFLAYVNDRASKSKYPLDVEITATDKILTLITCSYEFNDARFVIHARKIE